MSTQTYIYYGHKAFDPELFRPIENWDFVKPKGGLWASPIDAQYGWAQWNEVSNYAICDPNNSFCFELLPTASITHIHTAKDLLILPRNTKAICNSSAELYCIDFNNVYQTG